MPERAAPVDERRDIHVLETPADVARAGADAFVASARDAIDRNGRFRVALSGGASPRPLYELLAREPFRSQLDWAKVEFFWGDERAVPPEHEDSNFRMASEALLAPLGIAASRVHRLEAERPDDAAAAAAYQKEIARVFGVPADGEPPRFDLILLGMGRDGHSASLFPYSRALQETAQWVVPNWLPETGARRLTLTVATINRAACVVFVVAGTEKAMTLADVLDGRRDPDRLPAQPICPAAGRLLWLADRQAARLLGSTVTPGEPQRPWVRR